MSSWEKLNPDRLSDEGLRLLEFMSRRVIGQSRAISRIVNAYEQTLSPLRKQRKPILSALFLGPSGVGKTHIAETLAEYFTGDPEGFTKIECANYFDRHMIAQVIGSPQGYVGYYDKPLLAQTSIDKPIFEKHKREIHKVNPGLAQNLNDLYALEKEIAILRRKNDPQVNDKIARFNQLYQEYQTACLMYLTDQRRWAVVLLDEVDKAHNQIHQFLLEAVSKGRATMASSEITRFYDTFLLLTSNYGSREIADAIRGKGIGFGATAKASNVAFRVAMNTLKKRMMPELLGRLRRNVVVFHELDKGQLTEIMELQLRGLNERLQELFPIELIVNDIIKEHLLENALEHPEFGARPIEEQIEADIEEPLSKIIGSGQVDKGDRVYVHMIDGEIQFEGEHISNQNGFDYIINGADFFTDEDTGFEIIDDLEDYEKRDK